MANKRTPTLTIGLLVVVAVIAAAYFLFGRSKPASPSLVYPPDVPKAQQIEHLMRAHLVPRGGNPVHNFLLYVENEPAGLTVHKGVGTVGRNDTPIDATYQYPVASITKPVVATLILQLEEEGQLSIDDKVATYLAGLDYFNFDRLHVLDRVPYADEITIAHLLQHRSGLGDIFIDTATRFNLSVLTHRKRQYSPQLIMERFFQYGLNEAPHFRPGAGYYYTDINYVLLGLIIEQVTGERLPQQIRARVLEPLGMDDTYFDFYEPVHGHGKRIDVYLGRINMTRYINTSYEWAGGGLVSTTEDMATFIQALFAGELFADTATLQKMLDNSENQADGETYALGINEYTLAGETFYGHGGFYGALLAYHPDKQITISAEVGQATPPFDADKLIATLLEIVTTP